MSLLETLRSVLRFRKIELDATQRRLARVANVDDLSSQLPLARDVTTVALLAPVRGAVGTSSR